MQIVKSFVRLILSSGTNITSVFVTSNICLVPFNNALVSYMNASKLLSMSPNTNSSKYLQSAELSKKMGGTQVWICNFVTLTFNL